MVDAGAADQAGQGAAGGQAAGPQDGSLDRAEVDSDAPASGGAPGSGGRMGTGGGGSAVIASGGTPATGGARSGGDVGGSGGAVTTGGSSSGGAPGTGGAVTTTGGSTATGGVVASGGSSATGGVTGSGGLSASGGIVGTGGAPATGGVSSGGAIGSGGVVASGGAPATGGMTMESTGGSGGSGGSAGIGGGGGGAGGGVPYPPGTTITYQAEQAFDIEEGTFENIHLGYTGTGYININNFANTFIWFIVDSPVAATPKIVVRYANGDKTDRPIAVTPQAANGTGVLRGMATGDWTNWYEEGPLYLNLAAGSNDVFLTSVSADGMPNIDRIDITW